MFVTPVFYPTAEISKNYRYLFLFNPMATICEGFRGVLLRNELPQIEHLLSTTIFSLLCLGVGWYYYARHQHELPEVL
jgi:ABC-2 type transport system permease protein